MFYTHTLGKTVLLQANIVRTARQIAADQGSGARHLLILCIWQVTTFSTLYTYRGAIIYRIDYFPGFSPQ